MTMDDDLELTIALTVIICFKVFELTIALSAILDRRLMVWSDICNLYASFLMF